MSNFWDDLTQGTYGDTTSLDGVLNRRLADKSSSVRLLTDKGREEAGLPLPAIAGTRVTFASNLGAVFSYPEPPHGGLKGTVVTVRTANGDDTSFDGMVFVKWDDSRFLPVHREHLRLATGDRRASSFRRIVAFGDLDDFLKVAGGSDLVHKATKDLWSLKMVDGEYVIERLFDEDGDPLKV
jgi:hypothetical protein